MTLRVRQLKFRGQPGGLCGRLSLLIAMAAFSAPVQCAEDVVAKCFGYKTWEPHSYTTGIGRMSNLVSFECSHFLDIFITRVWLICCRIPRTRSSSDNISGSGCYRRNNSHLRAFEEGKYGPIFAPFPTTATSQTSAYTFQQAAIPTPYGTAGSVPRSSNVNYQMPAASSGYAPPAGYTTSPGYTTSSGQAAPPGYTTSPGYSTSSGQAAPAGYNVSPGYSTSSGQAAPAGYTVPPGYTASSGYPASTGNTAPSRYPASQHRCSDPPQTITTRKIINQRRRRLSSLHLHIYVYVRTMRRP